MKRCPACHKTYDETQNFCLDDGTTLLSVAADSYSSAPSAGNPPFNRNQAQTELLQGVPTAGGYQGPTTPPPPYAPQYTQPPAQKRSPLPWVIVGALVLVAAIVGIILATRNSSSSIDTTTTKNVGHASASPTPSPGATSSTPIASGSLYNSPDGRFQITLPAGFGPFTSQTHTQSTPAGPVDLNIMQSETARGACVMGYSDFPEATFEGRTPKKMLEDGRDGALKNINATLEKQEDITVQGRTGLDIYGSATSDGRDFYVRFQFVLDKPRAYQIGYLAYDRAELDKPEVQAYFDSFRMK